MKITNLNEENFMSEIETNERNSATPTELKEKGNSEVDTNLVNSKTITWDA